MDFFFDSIRVMRIEKCQTIYVPIPTKIPHFQYSSHWVRVEVRVGVKVRVRVGFRVGFRVRVRVGVRILARIL